MKTSRSLFVRLFALTALGMLAQGDLQAQTSHRMQLASHAERLASLEAELASLRGGGGGGYAEESCKGCGSTDCCCGPTWIIGYEAPYLQVNDGSLLFPGSSPTMTPHYGSEQGYRFIAGRRLCSGLGARVRYFDFEDRTGVPTLGASLDLYAIDLEFTHTANFNSWNTIMSGGVRIAGIEQTLDAVSGSDTIDVNRDFDGAGLTFAVEFERTCWWRCLGLFGNFRGSLLFGDNDTSVAVSGSTPVSASTVTIPNETIAVWEIQAGLQFERETRYGMLVSRIGAEAQLWEQPPMVLGVLDSNIGLVGPVVSVMLHR